MKQGLFTIRKNVPLTADVYALTLAGDTSAITAPGQFIDLRIPGKFLRRPISVCDWDGGSVTVLYKLVGEGTRALAAMAPGAALDVLTGLGNGFSVESAGPRPLLAGGGIGAAPLYRLAKELTARGAAPVIALGFNRKEDIFYEEEFRALGAEVLLATADGSAGLRGFVTDAAAAAGPVTCVYACGPTPMLRALDRVISGPAQLSFEERMGCGFGACMGCTVETKNSPRRVCKDGPVFRREEVLW